jgi:hypothetical protein
MAEVQWEGQVVGLNFIVCGPSQVGKSTILGALRAPLRAFDDGENALRCAPLELTGSDVTLGVVPKFVEVHSEMTVEEQATPLLATTDGVLFVSDSRRERLRDDVVAWAWLLEHLRAAKRDDVPIVVCYHRRDAANAMPTSDLDGALGVAPLLRPTAAMGACSRRRSGIAVRARKRRRLARRSWPVPERDVKLSECNATRNRPRRLAPVGRLRAGGAGFALRDRRARGRQVPVRPEDTMVHPEAAHRVRRARRAPLLRFTTHCFGEADRVGRERRRLLEQLKCVVEDSRRPMAFLKTLFDHLDRERKRLPVPLQEGIAGGEEILGHLERVLVTARRGSSKPARSGRASAPSTSARGSTRPTPRCAATRRSRARACASGACRSCAPTRKGSARCSGRRSPRSCARRGGTTAASRRCATRRASARAGGACASRRSSRRGAAAASTSSCSRGASRSVSGSASRSSRAGAAARRSRSISRPRCRSLAARAGPAALPTPLSWRGWPTTVRAAARPRAAGPVALTASPRPRPQPAQIRALRRPQDHRPHRQPAARRTPGRGAAPLPRRARGRQGGARRRLPGPPALQAAREARREAEPRRGRRSASAGWRLRRAGGSGRHASTGSRATTSCSASSPTIATRDKRELDGFLAVHFRAGSRMYADFEKLRHRPSVRATSATRC